MPTRIDKLTPEQEARFDEWADRWIEIGLRTGPADRDLFERLARACYGYAGLEWPGRVVWVPSPLVLALAAPTAAYLLEGGGAVGGAVDRAVSGAVREAVDRAVDEAVNEAVSGAVDVAVNEAVNEAVHGAVHGVVDEAVREAVHGAVHGVVDEAVREAVDVAVRGAVHGAVRRAVRGNWHRVLGGQFWVGGPYWGAAWTSYFREVCGLELPGDLWDRARAYEGTMQAACWWWPHRQFVMVSERPLVIHRELVDPALPRGWGSHRLHCDDGPAVVWPDGWGVWAHHGVRVPQQVVERPDTLTPAQILGEENAEVRRVMMERFGPERLLRETAATVLDDDPEHGTLYRLDFDDDEPLVMVKVVNSTPEPDGSFRDYWLRVPPDMGSAAQAVAWTFEETPESYRVGAAS